MRRLVARALSIGADPSDDEEQRLRKILLLTAAFAILPLATCHETPLAPLGPPWRKSTTSCVTMVGGVRRRIGATVSDYIESDIMTE